MGSSRSQQFSAIKKSRLSAHCHPFRYELSSLPHHIQTSFIVLRLRSPVHPCILKRTLFVARSPPTLKNVLDVEDPRTRLRQLPSSSSDAGEQLPRALHVYDGASATARANCVGFLQTTREFTQGDVDAVGERRRFQNGCAWRQYSSKYRSRGARASSSSASLRKVRSFSAPCNTDSYMT